MTAERVQWFDDNGRARVRANGLVGCVYGDTCNFVHPEDANWDTTPRGRLRSPVNPPSPRSRTPPRTSNRLPAERSTYSPTSTQRRTSLASTSSQSMPNISSGSRTELNPQARAPKAFMDNKASPVGPPSSALSSQPPVPQLKLPTSTQSFGEHLKNNNDASQAGPTPHSSSTTQSESMPSRKSALQVAQTPNGSSTSQAEPTSSNGSAAQAVPTPSSHNAPQVGPTSSRVASQGGPTAEEMHTLWVNRIK